MRVVNTVAELRPARARLERPVGFVPTMGALHAGHLSLVERACKECASVVVSIFVNPLQFAPDEDFVHYPRTLEHDCQLLAAHGVDLVFVPATAEMYSDEPRVSVDPGALGAHFEGERRPGHFRGVATVVLKLFNMVAPDKAYFGQKDAQQLAIVQRMVSDFGIALDIVWCPTVREPDGLALSSRNVYLSTAERASAVNLSRTLQHIAQALETGQADVARIVSAAVHLLGPLQSDYLAVVRPAEFQPLTLAPPQSQLLVIGAAFAGKTRLIDNIQIQTP